MNRNNKTGRINLLNSLTSLKKKGKETLLNRILRFNCSSEMETWGDLGTLLFVAFIAPVLAASPQQIQPWNRQITKFWGGWVGPTRKGKTVSFPSYQWTHSQDYHEIKQPSPQGGDISYERRAHLQNKSTWREECRPMPDHYLVITELPSIFNLDF